MRYNDYVRYELAHGRVKPTRLEHALGLQNRPSIRRNIESWKSTLVYGQNVSNAGVKNEFGSVLEKLSTENVRQLRRALTGRASSKTPRAQAERDVANALNKMMP